MTSQTISKISFPVRWVLDPKVSPLRHLAVAQRFQVMCLLGTMWTIIFCLSFGLWAHYGFLLGFHVLMAMGALVTGLTFSFASSARSDPAPASIRNNR